MLALALTSMPASANEAKVRHRSCALALATIALAALALATIALAALALAAAPRAAAALGALDRARTVLATSGAIDALFEVGRARRQDAHAAPLNAAHAMRAPRARTHGRTHAPAHAR
jgi:hypothetical protein